MRQRPRAVMSGQIVFLHHMQNHIVVSGVRQMSVADIIGTFAVQFDIAVENPVVITYLGMKEIGSGLMIPFAAGQYLESGSGGIGQHGSVGQLIPV